MIHQKIIQTSEERLGNLAIDAMKMAKSLATSPNGSASYTNSDGTRTVLGAQNITGSTMATHVGDTTPPGVPTGVTAWSGDGSVHVAWDGTLTGGIPADFLQVNLLVDGRAFATLTGAGSTTCNGVATGSTVSVTATAEDDVCAIDGTPAHNVSAACTAISVTVTDVADGLSKLIRETEDGVDVGKSADGTTYADGMSVTRQGTDGSFSILKALSGALTTVASFGESVIELGKNNVSSVIKMCGGKVSVSAVPDAKGRYTGILSGDYGARMRSTNGTASIGVDGFQDLISMVSGYLQVDDGADALTQVSMRSFLTAIQPAMLYNGGAALNYDTAPGAGTNGTPTLSEDATHFKELTLYLTDNTGRYAGAFPLAPLPGHTTIAVGQTCDVFGFEAADGERTWTYIRRTRYTLSTATTLVPSNGGWVSMRSGFDVSFSADGVNYLRVYRVTGRR